MVHAGRLTCQTRSGPLSQERGGSGDGKGALRAAERLLELLDTLKASPISKVVPNGFFGNLYDFAALWALMYWFCFRTGCNRYLI